MGNLLVYKDCYDRNIENIACQKCNGFCDAVEASQEEINKYQTCGRSYECCISVFVCRLCNQRILVHLNSPEME